MVSVKVNIDDLLTSEDIEFVYGKGPYRVEAMYEGPMCRCNTFVRRDTHQCLRVELRSCSIIVPSIGIIRTVKTDEAPIS